MEHREVFKSQTIYICPPLLQLLSATFGFISLRMFVLSWASGAEDEGESPYTSEIKKNTKAKLAFVFSRLSVGAETSGATRKASPLVTLALVRGVNPPALMLCFPIRFIKREGPVHASKGEAEGEREGGEEGGRLIQRKKKSLLIFRSCVCLSAFSVWVTTTRCTFPQSECSRRVNVFTLQMKQA